MAKTATILSDTQVKESLWQVVADRVARLLSYPRSPNQNTLSHHLNIRYW